MLNTFNLETRYFTPVEKNTLLLPFTKTIAYNRLIWLGISFIITAIAYYKFSFFQFLSADIEKTKKPNQKKRHQLIGKSKSCNRILAMVIQSVFGGS